MARAFVLVLDSLGVGGARDAGRFGEQGADTLGHIAAACADRRCDDRPGPGGPLNLPHLTAAGLGAAGELSSGTAVPGCDAAPAGDAVWGAAQEQSRGKDTPSGHWEIAGVPVFDDWGYFPKTQPTFPSELTDALIERCGLPGVLGDCHASGTAIIEELGDTHLTSGKPIVYTSADSVFQIAAHEEAFGLDRLYAVCEVARHLVDEYRIGRVIARPFVGTSGAFRRTGNRRDYATPPPSPTLLQRLTSTGGKVYGVGKIADIFAHRGVSEIVKGDGNAALMKATSAVAERAESGSLVFVNFVDFDSLFGHRRDVAGYAAALEAFDSWLPEFKSLLRPGDLAVITADHGCDPTWTGSDHTRENVPVLAFGPGISGAEIGIRHTFADIGQTLAGHLGLSPLDHGESFLSS